VSNAISEPSAAAPKLRDIAAIAVIDDAFIPVAAARLPEEERVAVLALLSELDDAEALHELKSRGFDAAACASSPDEVLDALTDPDHALGHAFARLSMASGTLGTMIEERLAMRQVVAWMRAASGCQVLEVSPNAEIPDLNDHQLVFIDYYLEGGSAGGSRAENIAQQVEQARNTESPQQIVLMSSQEKVRTFRKQFRQAAGVDGAAFSFVAKNDLDQPWKVRAHLEMFARALPHSRSIAAYVNAAKLNMEKAQKDLGALLDDIDLGDFAYLQNQALRADGHPLGDYLSWLLSSHLASLAFERDLRTEQAVVDAMNFDESLVSPAEPSTVVATFYHSALFARNQGPLGSHPRAKTAQSFADIPLVQLGDVFVDDALSKAVVVLSADCDLAFSPSPERMPDKETPVLLVQGTPKAVMEDPGKPSETHTHGMELGSEVYRIDWKFSSYRTVPLGELKVYLGEQGYQLSNRDRLRPLYALKLQQEFGNHVLRVGPPIMPPFHVPMIGEIFECMDERTTSVGILKTDELYASWFKGDLKIRITPSIAGRLRAALEQLLTAMHERLNVLRAADQDDTAKKAVKSLEPKVNAVTECLAKDEQWIQLLGDQELSLSLKRKFHGLFFVRGKIWTAPSEPAIILQITDRQKSASIDGASDEGPSQTQEDEPVIAVAVEADGQVSQTGDATGKG
jgi:hypothetical protein